MERGKCNCGQSRKSVDFLKKCAGELPAIPASDHHPTRIVHDDLWSRRLRGVELVSTEVITGMVLEAGSRMKFEASQDRARVNVKVRKWALGAVMGAKKAAHAYLKVSETINTPAMLGEDRRDGETPFVPQCIGASVQLIGPKFGNAARPSYLVCIKPFTRVGPKPRRLIMLDLPSPMGLWPVQSREKRNWHRSLDTTGTGGTARCGDCESGLRCETDRCLAHHSAAVSHEPYMSVAQAGWRRETHRASVPAACSVEQLPCRCNPCLGCCQSAVLGLCGQRVQCLAARNPQEDFSRKWAEGTALGRCFCLATAGCKQHAGG